MLSSTLGGFFMKYRTYSAEYKMSMINEYLSRNITIRNFVKEKDIGLSTFESWLTKLRKAGQLGYKRNKAISESEKEMKKEKMDISLLMFLVFMMIQSIYMTLIKLEKLIRQRHF